MIDFRNFVVNEDWCFKNVRSTEQWTHGYHRYPAKFLPNIVSKIIKENTNENDIIGDVFAGCGTTLVEAKINGRNSIGVDINPIAKLITEVKTSPIDPKLLQKYFDSLILKFQNYDEDNSENIELNERIDYWFTKENKFKIAFLFEKISEIKIVNIKKYFLVSLSHILKNSSKWLQSSTKPQIDKSKEQKDPFDLFIKHSKKMMKKNEEFYNKLKQEKKLNTQSKILLGDARKTSIPDNYVTHIVTSPPYVTSYEYADIHQLTGYWFKYFKNLKDFRKGFIGTSYTNNKNITTKSERSQIIVNSIKEINSKKAKEVANYFNDMYEVAVEMNRILKSNGYAHIVIGNTNFKNIHIESAEVFYEYLLDNGFEKVDIIKRSIPNKLIPSIRDKETGKFTKTTNKNSQEIYPEEYILVLKKK